MRVGIFCADGSKLVGGLESEINKWQKSTLELATELRNAGFPNIQDLQPRQGRPFLASDGHESFYSLGELACAENWFIPTRRTHRGL
jgi:hypothetical protein